MILLHKRLCGNDIHPCFGDTEYLVPSLQTLQDHGQLRDLLLFNFLARICGSAKPGNHARDEVLVNFWHIEPRPCPSDRFLSDHPYLGKDIIFPQNLTSGSIVLETPVGVVIH